MSKENCERLANEMIFEGTKFGKSCVGPIVGLSQGEIKHAPRIIYNTPTCLSFFAYRGQFTDTSSVINDKRSLLFDAAITKGTCDFFRQQGGISPLCDQQDAHVEAAKKNFLDLCNL